MTGRTTRRPLLRLGASEQAALLGSDVSATLAFVDAAGHPRIVPCWFLWAEGAFFISSQPEKFHVRCLRANPRASVCVEREEVVPGERRTNRQFKGVGEVEIFEDPDGTWTARIRAKYLARARLPDLGSDYRGRVIIKLEPTKVSAHGGSIEAQRPGAIRASERPGG